MTRVDKPALLRRLFELGCAYSGQILSYNKMLGQLVDAGNTTTLAHYLDLLSGAGMLAGIGKFGPSPIRRRASSPKLLVRNTALATALSGRDPAEIRSDPAAWGRWIESAVGAHLVNTAARTLDVFYWRDAKGREVDFVLRRGARVAAIEVKSGREKGVRSGLEAFTREFPRSRSWIVGSGGIPVSEFLSTPAEVWLDG
jgi:predicted AAA+ superfamily ATPase